MASYESVNYSLRPSKSIERQIVFEGVREIQVRLGLEMPVYVGFGSIWFTDFLMAHKLLKIDDMISIEREEIGYERAKFNSPYATVQVKYGMSGDILPALFHDDLWKSRPWFVWLDYDGTFDETARDDVRMLVEKAPANSIVMSTFNGHEGSYGTPAPSAVQRLRDLFGSVVPDELSNKSVKGARMQETLADFALDFMQAVASDASRPGGFLPSFRIVYKDGSPMVTVGGILPTKEKRSDAERLVNGDNWLCRPRKPIAAPHLTMREAAVLQSQLPCTEALSRNLVRSLGFDLEEKQIETFQSYYRQYPTFAQILA